MSRFSKSVCCERVKIKIRMWVAVASMRIPVVLGECFGSHITCSTLMEMIFQIHNFHDHHDMMILNDMREAWVGE